MVSRILVQKRAKMCHNPVRGRHCSSLSVLLNALINLPLFFLVGPILFRSVSSSSLVFC